eukprot:TRINITY_DN26545_c0_g1_i2.p1 TRINITY_DN26545_c0_g1~~TRINITY_DN26545_c0_g1_i2.p1  ORF type:complete len:226 (-),score=53.33 TRINITY_DN26545_c0_g1_i2:361-1038(-)
MSYLSYYHNNPALFYSFFFVFFFFKQKTAYEMLRSLVGSEMCIRDRYCFRRHLIESKWNAPIGGSCFLQCGLTAGVVQSILTKNKKLFSTDKFFSGGPHPVRGFQMGRLGPQLTRGSDTIGLGGDGLLAMHANLLCPVPGGWLANMNAHVQMFVNAGSLVDTGGAGNGGMVPPLGRMFEQLEHSTGVGLVVPFGPGRIELNYCAHPEGGAHRDSVQLGMHVDWHF